MSEVRAGMEWLGLDWLGLILNVFAIAIIPGLLAAYGGHLAAEAITNPKRSRTVKHYFWALFVFGVLATFWQQYRAAESDLDRDTKDKWAEAVVASKFLLPPAPATIERGKDQVIPRSYISFANQARFPEKKDANGQLVQDQHVQVGDALGFNLYFSCSGPHPVEVLRLASWLYVISSWEPDAQTALIANFKALLDNEVKSPHSGEPSTMVPGEERFLTAFASRDQYPKMKYWQVTPDDLQEFRAGTEISFAIAEITYKDNGVIHHARHCSFLQPPADPPGIWHFCEGFNKSD